MSKYILFVPKVIHPAELLTQSESLGTVTCTLEDRYHGLGSKVTLKSLLLEIWGSEPYQCRMAPHAIELRSSFPLSFLSSFAYKTVIIEFNIESALCS